MFNAAIVEDSDTAAQSLAAYVDRYGTDHRLELVTTRFTCGDDFLEAKRTFDLVFMDIDMPGLDGLETSAAFREYNDATPLIFVTNLAQYAIRGYEVDALGFLVKPVGWSDFCACLDRVMPAVQRAQAQTLTVSTRFGTHHLRLSDLPYIEVRNHAVLYHGAPSEEPVQARSTLREVEDSLAGTPFVRISNNALVNMDHVTSVRGDEVALRDGRTLFMSRSRKKEATEAITRYFAGGRLS